MKIADITAYALSFPVSAKGAVSLGIGRKVKRDTVVVKVTTDEGLIGFGEACARRHRSSYRHHMRQPLLGRDACDVVATWRTV
jgi:D-galactarolactone cycloisomerase